MRKTLAVTAGAVVVVVGLATPAAADPKRGEVFTLHCDNGLGDVRIITFGNGEWTPGLVLDGTRVLTPYAFDISGTFTLTGDTEPIDTFHDTSSKNGPAHGRTATCSLHETITDPYGTAVIDGTVSVAWSH